MDYENVKQMVLQNVGISLLPSRFVQQEQLQGTLVTIDLSKARLPGLHYLPILLKKRPICVSHPL
ncbi:LysR substrate-binding domain-containing protein [Brevibacillus laterosporus]|uniref:LysR substrate-binding domain-containing protein n=1 Tax=Brevibacillus laterosporus TaxID=1465 RepID=UPI0020D13661|nr:LysR substrate-binding domain-containing protein [Brevibacillus laterosporus]